MQEQERLLDIISNSPKNQVIQKALMTAYAKIELFDKIACSVSGGSDSDIMMDILERVRPNNKQITYVWFDTGMEYEATKRHLVWLEEKYDISICREKAAVPVICGCRKYGIPFLTKRISQHVHRMQKHQFTWGNNRCKISETDWNWWNNKNGEKSMFNINRNFLLKEYMSLFPPTFDISDMCCKGAKKETANNFDKKYNPDLKIIGIRKSEGGARSTAYKNCFSEQTDGHCSEYRPLFFFSNKDKAEYKQHYNITYSDCYEVWGMKRTGCAGCPFGSNFEEELILMEKYEPKLYKAALSIFGESYNYIRKYKEFKSNFNNVK